jgi:quercetin dioxygenase-like cupin family protein
MPIEIRRFGVGHRRAIGPLGSLGVTGVVLHSDGRATVTEVALARSARIEPHAAPDAAFFIVIEGGGWVGVGEERARIAAGEMAVWPADVVHSAWTEHSELRALVVELAGADDSAVGGQARELGEGEADLGARGIGQLAERAGDGHDRPSTADEGEPA